MSQRNNLERALGANPVNPDQGSPATETTSATTFSFVTPTDFVDLPSKGRFYGEGHPLHNTETIEIRHMTAKEEDILTSESLLKRGIAVDRLLQSVITDKTIKIQDLLVGDKNAVIMATRITGFGPIYDTAVRCPSCSETNEHSFDLEELTLDTNEETPENVTLLPNGNFQLELEIGPNTFTVEMRLLTGADEDKWTARKTKKKKLKLPESPITDQLKMIIVGVNEFTEGNMIDQFINVLPTTASRRIRAVYEQMMPDVDMTQDFTCENCSYEGRVGVPLGVDFFWPDV